MPFTLVRHSTPWDLLTTQTPSLSSRSRRSRTEDSPCSPCSDSSSKLLSLERGKQSFTSWTSLLIAKLYCTSLGTIYWFHSSVPLMDMKIMILVNTIVTHMVFPVLDVLPGSQFLVFCLQLFWNLMHTKYLFILACSLCLSGAVLLYSMTQVLSHVHVESKAANDLTQLFASIQYLLRFPNILNWFVTADQLPTSTTTWPPQEWTTDLPLPPSLCHLRLSLEEKCDLLLGSSVLVYCNVPLCWVLCLRLWCMLSPSVKRMIQRCACWDMLASWAQHHWELYHWEDCYQFWANCHRCCCTILTMSQFWKDL